MIIFEKSSKPNLSLNLYKREKLVDPGQQFHAIFTTLDGNENIIWDLPVSKEFIGRKTYEEIQMEIERANEFVVNRGSSSDLRRGAQCENLKGYSAASI